MDSSETNTWCPLTQVDAVCITEGHHRRPLACGVRVSPNDVCVSSLGLQPEWNDGQHRSPFVYPK